MKLIYSLMISLLSFSMIQAQLPETSIYSFVFNKDANDQVRLSSPKLLTGFNDGGYNNQAQFIDSKTIYLSVKQKNKEQTDIYSLDLYNRLKKQITDTPDSEYSPTLMPDGNHFSCVRIENDGKETQRLWKFPLNRSNNGEPILSNITGVGYHCWLSPKKVALFIVGEPHRMVIGDIESNSITELTSNIGRGMVQLKNGHLAFVQKLSESSWYIKDLDPDTYRSSIIIETLKGSEDFIVMSDGTFIMGQKSKLYTYHPVKDKNKSWKEVADLNSFGISNITRLAFNENRTLIVIDYPNPG